MDSPPPLDPAVLASPELQPEEAERWRRTEDLFHRALAYPPSDRQAQARSWCGSDTLLLDQLLALLASDSSIEELLASASPARSEAHLLRQNSPEPASAPDPWLGRTLGAFRIERLLGRGGMGVVYLGRRITEGFTQTVAIKIVARHLSSSPALSQFLLERDALAKLEHPNIARLLDGGVFQGTPYLVMEYVDGGRLDTLCDNPATPVQSTIGLMLQLCDAVTYVHRNLILHRDLKPGNVMVTAEGVVKLLDFGTLKLMAPLAPSSDMTQAGMRPLTLRYASPEHIRGQAVSTASDVFGLGMVLYRLLAGHLPPIANQAASLAGGKDGIKHGIKSGSKAEWKGWNGGEEGNKNANQNLSHAAHNLPDNLSDNLSLPHYLEHLRTQPPPPCAGKPVSPRLARDLDAIVLKSIRYEPETRYSNVSALAADLTNALHDQPVSAREGNLRYRLGKLYRNRRTAILGAAAILLVLAAGVAAIAHQGRIARIQTRRAEAGVESERNLAHLLLFDYFEQLKQVPGSTAAQHKAVAQALAYLDSLTNIPIGSNLELDKVQAYTEMGVLLGDTYEENLGDAPAATKTLEKILPEALRMAAAYPDNLVVQQAAAAAQTSLGQVYNGVGHARQAMQYLVPAGETSRRIAAAPGATVPMLIQSAYVLNSLGDVYGQQSDFSLHDVRQSMSIYRESLAINQHALTIDPRCARCRSGVALAYWKLGMMSREDDQDQAAEYYRQGLATLAAFTPAEQETTRIRRMDTFIRHRLGEVYLSNGHVEQGVRMLETTRQRFQLAVAADKLDSRTRWDLGPLDQTLGEGYEQLKQDAKALDAYREYTQAMDFLVQHNPSSATYQEARAESLLSYGRMLHKLGQPQPGDKATEEGLAIILPIANKPGAETNELDLAANELVRLHRDPKHDAPLALSFAQRELAASSEITVEQLLTLAEAQRFAGLTAQSQQTAQKALKLQSLHAKGIDSTAQGKQIRQLLP